MNHLLMNYLIENDNILKSNLIDKNEIQTSEYKALYHLLNPAIQINKNELNDIYYNGNWIEKGYNDSDDDIGYPGIIPAVFWLLAITNKVEQTQLNKKLVHETINKFLNLENYGRIRKTNINKNDVFNTQLLASLAMAKAISSGLVNPNSYKATLIMGNIRRTVLRTILFQLPNGKITYQSNSLKYSIIYHSICTTALIKLKPFINDNLLDYSIKLAMNQAKKYIAEGFTADWSLDTSQDKIGAKWIYPWSINCIEKQQDLLKHCLDKIYSSITLNKCLIISGRGEKVEEIDTAWYIFGLFISSTTTNASIQSKFSFRFYLFTAVGRSIYIFNKTSRYIFNKIFFIGNEPSSW